MNSDFVEASLSDLDGELGRHGASASDRLRKIVCFCSTSLALHDEISDEHLDRLERALSEIAERHGLPEGCLGPSQVSTDSTSSATF